MTVNFLFIVLTKAPSDGKKQELLSTKVMNYLNGEIDDEQIPRMLIELKKRYPDSSSMLDYTIDLTILFIYTIVINVFYILMYLLF